MKKILIKEYIQGLSSFLDEERIKWEATADGIVIYYKKSEDLFRIGFEFGKFYELID